jgi:hypothetical protein
VRRSRSRLPAYGASTVRSEGLATGLGGLLHHRPGHPRSRKR